MDEVNKFLLTIEDNITLPTTISDQTILSGEIRIPNQCWKGYYDIAQFTRTLQKPISYSEFFDFEKTILNTGCGICAALGAINFLTNSDFTVLDAYRKGLAIIRKSSRASLVSFRNTSKFGVSSTDTQYIAYDIGRNYSWVKSSKNYTSTSSIITTAKINAYKNLFYIPSDTTITYHQAKGSYTPGNKDDLLAYQGGAYCAAQAQAIERIKNMDFADECGIIYINSPVRNCGHYVLAVGYSTAHSGYYSYDDIIVWDPCAVSTSTYNNRTEYYGRRMTLTESMKRINCDISDGIRTIQTCRRISD